MPVAPVTVRVPPGIWVPTSRHRVLSGSALGAFKQFYSAVRYGLNGNGTNLCLAMARFSESDISEQGMRDLYEYLSSKPAVDVPNGGTACP